VVHSSDNKSMGMAHKVNSPKNQLQFSYGAVLVRSISNPTDKGACNSVYHQYYGQNSNMASSVTMCKIGYIILTYNKDVKNGPPHMMKNMPVLLFFHCTVWLHSHSFALVVPVM